MTVGLLIIRLTVGALISAHGAQKLFGWFGAKHREPITDEFAGYGYHPARVFATAAGVTEIVAGALAVAGFATPVAGALIVATSSQAIRAAKWHAGPWIQDGGYEYLLTLAAIGLVLGFAGAGTVSLDHVLGLRLQGVLAGCVVAAIGLVSLMLPKTIPSFLLPRSSRIEVHRG